MVWERSQLWTPQARDAASPVQSEGVGDAPLPVAAAVARRPRPSQDAVAAGLSHGAEEGPGRSVRRRSSLVSFPRGSTPSRTTQQGSEAISSRQDRALLPRRLSMLLQPPSPPSLLQGRGPTLFCRSTVGGEKNSGKMLRASALQGKGENITCCRQRALLGTRPLATLGGGSSSLFCR